MELRVSLEAYEGIYRGRPVLRCQLWRREDAVADWLPTRKCLSARIEEIPLLLTAFQEAAELLSPIYPELFEREDRPVQGEGWAR